jgi:excisionase family DNA binding protein
MSETSHEKIQGDLPDNFTRLREERPGLRKVSSDPHRTFSEADGIEPLPPRRLIDVEALAALWSVSTATLYNWVFQKRIPYVKLGRALRFDLEELEEFRRRCTIPLAGKR